MFSFKRFLVAFIVIISVLIPRIAFSNNIDMADWPCFGHDIRNTRMSPVIAAQDNNVRWRYDLCGWYGFFPETTIVESSSYLVDLSTLYSYSTEDPHQIKWGYDTRFYMNSTPAIYNETLYVGCQDGKLYAFDANEGGLKWTFETGSCISSSPAVFDDVIYVGSTNKCLYAINEDGTLKWEYQAMSGVSSSPAICVPRESVYFADNTRLYSLDMNDGSLKWDYMICDPNEDMCWYGDISPALGHDGTVYLAYNDLLAFNPDGTIKWTLEIDDYFRSAPAICSASNVYIGDTGGYFYSIDGENGTVLWSYQTQNAIFSSPAIGGDGNIYFGSVDGVFYALDQEGIIKWFYPTQRNIYDSPTIGPDGTVYIRIGDTMFAFGEPLELE